jgi:methylated-DNA-[protein]-cysteine S-methyltransferase
MSSVEQGTPLSTAGPTHTRVPSVLGELTLVAREGALVGLYFPHHWYRPDPRSFGTFDEDGFEGVRTQIDEYLAGDRIDFDVPLCTDGDDLQESVWGLVRQIPYGETTTYGALAHELGEGSDPKDVGAAVGKNPLCLLVPCHRVIGAGGKLTGYAGGLERKRFLLDLEAEVSDRRGRLF